MCGIAGFVGEGDRCDLERMTRRLAHRGPDAEGFYRRGGRRGASRASATFDYRSRRRAQPMVEADGRCVIVFNGEIYNHLELRADLEAQGCAFQSDHSDTEVLLHGYCVWGKISFTGSMACGPLRFGMPGRSACFSAATALARSRCSGSGAEARLRSLQN